MKKEDFLEVAYTLLLVAMLSVIGSVLYYDGKEAAYKVSNKYMSDKLDSIDKKYVAMKDSAMAHVNEPDTYNRYLDSVGKYAVIHNYHITLKPCLN